MSGEDLVAALLRCAPALSNTQLMMAPERTPGIIMGTVILRNVVISEAPREMAASSMLGSICCREDTPARMPMGRLRTIKATTKRVAVPVSTMGGVLNARM